MVGQASSWLHLDNGFISLWAMWKLCPSSLIHEQWNEQESKILPRDILAVRQCGDPAPHSQGWGDSISMSLYCCFLLGGKRFKVATNEPVMIWLLEYEGNFSVISYLELRKGLWLEQNAPGGSLSTFAVFSSTPSPFSRSVFCKCFCILRSGSHLCSAIWSQVCCGPRQGARSDSHGGSYARWKWVPWTFPSKSHNKQNLSGN